MSYIFKVLMIAVMAIGLACQTTQANLVDDETSVGSDGTARITIAGGKKLFDSGSAVFVDTRSESQFNAERIKGAINIPAETAATRWKEIPTDKKIIAYCS